MKELKSFLIKQNCALQTIEYGIIRAMSLDKHVLRTVKEKCEEKSIPYVSTHNPKDPEMFRVILDNVQILKEDDKMWNMLSKYQLIKSKRQSYSLKRLLTKAKFTSNNTLKVTKCNKPNCGICVHPLEGHSFTFKCGKKINIHENMSCDVQNLIYVINCRGCGEEYIGQTGNLLRQRVEIHNQQIYPLHKNT